MQQIRIGTVSALNLAAGTVDVRFLDRVAVGLWLLDSANVGALTVNSSVVCLFPSGDGEGVCLGRHYCKGYAPAGQVVFDRPVEIKGNLRVTGTVTAANFP